MRRLAHAAARSFPPKREGCSLEAASPMSEPHEPIDAGLGIEASPHGALRRANALLFVALLALGPLLRVLAEPMWTAASKDVPAFDWSGFREGEWASGVERHLQETSPVTAWFRGVYNEARVLLGVYESPAVHLGRGGWLFVPASLDPDVEKLAADSELRLGFLRDVRDKADRLGVRILVAPVPDKVRIYPDRAFADGVLREPKLGAYARILAELDQAGLDSVDLASPLLELRAARPEEPLYYRRDTHWTPAATTAASHRIWRRVVELGWGEDLGERVRHEAVPFTSVERLPDLARLIGLVPGGVLESALRERLDHNGLLEVAGADRRVPVDVEQPAARIAVCGDSFAPGLVVGIAGHSGLRVDGRGVLPAMGPVAGLVAIFDAIESGRLAARVVVWQLVERSWVELGWRRPARL